MDLAHLGELIHPYVDFVAAIGVVLTLIAILVAWLQLWDAHMTAARQMEASNQYAIAQNWIALRAILTAYDDIHANLRPRGSWYASKEKPNTITEWARTEIYMGTFEFMDELVEKNMLDIRHVIDWYKYRVENILLNPKIVKYKLIDNVNGWVRFCKLCERLDLKLPEEQRELADFITLAGGARAR